MVEQPLLGIQFGLVGDVFQLLFADHVDCDLNQVADHGLHVAPDVPDFREFRGLHLHERRVRELRQPPGDLGFPNARRADHDDVLRNDLFGQVRRELLPAHAVAQCNGDRPLGRVLPDHVLVEFRHDLARRQLIQSDLFFICDLGEIDSHKNQLLVVSC